MFIEVAEGTRQRETANRNRESNPHQRGKAGGDVMNQEEIISMAKEAGMALAIGDRRCGYIERFAALVAAREREACAKVCLELHSLDTPWGCAVAIRARGQKEGA
jgi:hypothetical protein